MSRLSNPGCMLRSLSALFGIFFLPVGISFFFVLHHRHWLQGVGAVAASLAFLYVAWKADDILGLDDIGAPSAADEPASLVPPEASPNHEEPHP